MAINVELRGYKDDVVARLSPGLEIDGHEFMSLDEAMFPYLSLIDEYAVTYFTPRQMAGVLPEILRLKNQRPDLNEVLSEVETLGELCSEKPHHYLVFLGD